MSTNDTLRGLLESALEVIKQGDFSTGYCCCGSSMGSHGIGDGHSPVDDGEYNVSRFVESASAALAEPVSGVADERAAFEAYESKSRRLSPDDQKIWFRRGEIADYDFRSIDDAWKAWQARAALNGGAVAGQSDAARDVLAERQRQVSAENWTSEWDDLKKGGDLSLAASCYASFAHAQLDVLKSNPPAAWPWLAGWWKPSTPRRNLVKAGALLLAEIERIDRQGRDARTCKPLESERGGE